MPRQWARISLALLFGGLAVTFAGVMLDLLPVVVIGIALMLGAVGVKAVKLRCPHCGAFTTTPQWSGSGKRCKKCGRSIEYDK